MSQLDRIRDQLRRSLEGPAWHGPSLMEVLKGVDRRQANERPIPDAHTIAELVPHVVTWMDVVRRRFQGDWAPVSDGDDFPRPASSEEAWTHAIAELLRAGNELDEALAEAPATDLDRLDPKGRFSLIHLLDGAVQHNLYHAGQIAVLKKGVGRR